MGKTLFQMPGVRSTTDAENPAGSSFAEMLPFRSSLWHPHCGSSESVGSRKPNPNIARHLSRDTYHQGARRQDMTATGTFPTLRQFWLKHYDAMESVDHGPGHRVQCRLSTPVPIQEYLARGG